MANTDSNRVEMLGSGIERGTIDLRDFIAPLVGGGPASLSYPFPASAANGTVLARFVDLFPDDVPVTTGSVMPAQLRLEQRADFQWYLVRTATAAVVGQSYSAQIKLTINTGLIEVPAKTWAATIPCLAV